MSAPLLTSPDTTLNAVLADELSSWNITHPAIAVTDGNSIVGSAGDLAEPHAWASVTKIVAALAVLDVVRERLLDLDEPAGPTGSTVRHLLGHTSGWGFDERRVIAAPGTRRIYSNVGIDAVAELASERASAPDVATLLRDRVLTPLGMGHTVITGPASHGAVGPLSDLMLLAAELLQPRTLHSEVVEAAITPSFPDTAGVLPGFGRQKPNLWGLGIEIRGTKSPHWTCPDLSPDAFGHFGQSGSFVWADRHSGIAVASLSDGPFGTWAAQAWPRTSARVLAFHDSQGGTQ